MSTMASPTGAGNSAEYNVRETARTLKVMNRTPTGIVCGALHISQATWFHRIRGDSPFTVGEVAELARLWKVSVGDFFEGRYAPPMPDDGGPAGSSITSTITSPNACTSSVKLGGLTLIPGGSIAPRPIGARRTSHLALIASVKDQDSTLPTSKAPLGIR